MNIFVTSSSPVTSARYLDDKRVVKMVLESAQILSTAINECGGTGPYKSTHINHPCNVWARTTNGNWAWLYEHFEALCAEYTSRYGKVHKCSQIGSQLISGMSYIPEGGLQAFVNCAANKSLNLDFKSITPTKLAYKLYLEERWRSDKRKPTWYGVA